ncbi:MAG TPA: DUF2235 domain-containing protein [Mucilaginibacter sp.]|nr:DUF2235 domain-containing protein [Mucilaginibacter sp.]
MKRIITCSDGTWNKPGDQCDGKYVQTNVQKLFEAICKSVTHDDTIMPQIKYYDEGIGSEGTPWSKMIDGATGKGIDDNIKDIYKFIIWNYEPGDELFLFGFSRGAYTARSLAGLIRNCGILKNNDMTLVEQAYQIYRDRDNPALNPNGAASQKFREENSHPEERIKFVGVWDTVGSLGIPVHAFQWIDKNKYQFHDTTLSSLVENAFHALAVDEKRGNFKPTLWTLSADVKNRVVGQVMEQVWFAGVHSNIGGGYPDQGLSDITFQWMAEKAKSCGLGFDEPYLTSLLNPNPEGVLYNSKTGIFKITPNYNRPVMETPFSNESIDPAVIERINKMPDYRPKNVKV